MTTCGLLWNDREVCDRKMFEKLHEKLSSEIIISVFVKIRKYECFCNVMYFQTFLLSVKGIDHFPSVHESVTDPEYDETSPRAYGGLLRRLIRRDSQHRRTGHV